MLTVTDQGLYCAAGDFHIDPWGPIQRALITHAHSDHARAGSRAYLCASAGLDVLRTRLGNDASITAFPYGQTIRIKDVTVSFHPAGHVLGSAQIRLEHHGEVWVVSGDYKLHADPTCTGFEPLRCHTFVTESTFGLPVYRWPEPVAVFEEIHQWWYRNQQHSRTSVLFGYALGKAQRLLAGLDPCVGPICVHGSVSDLVPAYVEAGVKLPATQPATRGNVRTAEGKALVLAPPVVDGSAWLDSLGEVSTAFASGWMLIRGPRRRRNADRGFVLSDHVDWPGLIQAIRATGASRVLVTHGAVAPVVRWLNENGWQAAALAAPFGAEGTGEAAV